MYKMIPEQRQENLENFRDGKGPVQVTHIMEKTELRANCRLFSKVTLPPGSSIGYHLHDKEEEVYFILSGQGEVNDNGEIRTVNPGDAVLTGNGASHSIENKSDKPLEFIGAVLTYNPPER
jgi:mannose-6-phosphate isomerase-like protein (cupin superfamily)